MPQVQCPYCHQMVNSADFDKHEAMHLEKQPDGQQKDYITLPEEQRAKGSLEGVPTVYRHAKCGQATGMPEEIIRSYLENPYLYGADATFCCGCNDHVPIGQCTWVETGENLQTYFDKLRASKPELKPKGCFAMVLLLLSPALLYTICR